MSDYPLKNIISGLDIPQVAKHVIVPEYERLSHALEVLAPLLMNPSLTTHQICDAADINYIEFSCDGWEHLYNYIRKLEKQTEELETLKAKLRNLIQLVEQSNEFIIKAYREATREE